MKYPRQCGACGQLVRNQRTADELQLCHEKDLAAADVIRFGRYINARGSAAGRDLAGLKRALEAFDAAERAHLEAMGANQAHRKKLRERAKKLKAARYAKAHAKTLAEMAARRAARAAKAKL